MASSWLKLISSYEVQVTSLEPARPVNSLFRVADLTQHAGLLDEIASLAETIRTGPQGVREQLIERWIGHEEHFAHV